MSKAVGYLRAFSICALLAEAAGCPPADPARELSDSAGPTTAVQTAFVGPTVMADSSRWWIPRESPDQVRKYVHEDQRRPDNHEFTGEHWPYA
jgi:hypothetical protein